MAGSGIPAPGTYPPPATGSGLPPLLSPKLRAWGRQATAKSRQAAANAPDKLRSWRQQAAVKSREAAAAGRRVAAGTPRQFRSWSRPVSRGPVVPHMQRPRMPVQQRPPWAPSPVPPRPRRKRRFRRVALLLLVALVLSFGAYRYVPGLHQYPVTAVLPGSFSDLTLRDTAASNRAAQRLAEQLQGAGSDGGTFAGIYADSRGKRVTVFGVTGLRLTPAADVDAQLNRLADTLSLKDVEAFETGTLGVHQRCGTGRLDGTSVVACAWADHGSLATVLLTRRSLTESAELVARLRSTVLTPA